MHPSHGTPSRSATSGTVSTRSSLGLVPRPACLPLIRAPPEARRLHRHARVGSRPASTARRCRSPAAWVASRCRSTASSPVSRPSCPPRRAPAGCPRPCRPATPPAGRRSASHPCRYRQNCSDHTYGTGSYAAVRRAASRPPLGACSASSQCSVRNRRPVRCDHRAAQSRPRPPRQRAAAGLVPTTPPLTESTSTPEPPPAEVRPHPDRLHHHVPRPPGIAASRPRASHFGHGGAGAQLDTASRNQPAVGCRPPVRATPRAGGGRLQHGDRAGRPGRHGRHFGADPAGADDHRRRPAPARNAAGARRPACGARARRRPSRTAGAAPPRLASTSRPSQLPGPGRAQPPGSRAVAQLAAAQPRPRRASRLQRHRVGAAEQHLLRRGGRSYGSASSAPSR